MWTEVHVWSACSFSQKQCIEHRTFMMDNNYATNLSVLSLILKILRHLEIRIPTKFSFLFPELF